METIGNIGNITIIQTSTSLEFQLKIRQVNCVTFPIFNSRELSSTDVRT